jgi:hypothetical protein
MSRQMKSDRASMARVIGVLFASLMATAAYAAGSAPPAQSVTVRVDHFTYETWSSGDIDTLAATMRAARPAWVELVGCGPDAAWALQSVAQRLSDLPLQLQALPLTAPACAGASTAKSSSQGIETSGAEKVAVARYWQQVMP